MLGETKQCAAYKKEIIWWCKCQPNSHYSKKIATNNIAGNSSAASGFRGL